MRACLGERVCGLWESVKTMWFCITGWMIATAFNGTL